MFMLEFLFFIFYIFLVLWILPFYPRFRNSVLAPVLHICVCILCAMSLESIIILIAYEKAVKLCLLIPLLIVCTYTDLKHQEIPDTAVILMAVSGFFTTREVPLALMIISFMFLISFFVFRMIGFGDLKLMEAMIMCAKMNALIGFIIASLLCLAVNVLQKKGSHENHKIPFAPYLCAGFLITLLLPV